VNNTSTGQADHPHSVDGDPPQQEAAPSDFLPTRPVDDEGHASDWWPESADGQCSESAALFAASQPAPLNVV